MFRMTPSELQAKKTAQLSAIFNAAKRDLTRFPAHASERALIEALLPRLLAELSRRGP